MFAQLAEITARYEGYTRLAFVDPATLARDNLTDVEHWEYNFKMIKAKLREVDKLDLSVKVGDSARGCVSLHVYPCMCGCLCGCA